MKKRNLMKQLGVIALSAVMVVTGGIVLPESKTVDAATSLKPKYMKGTSYSYMEYYKDSTGEEMYPRVLKKTTTLMVYPKTKIFKPYNDEKFEVIIKQLPDTISSIKLSNKSVASLKKMDPRVYKYFRQYVGAKGQMVLKPKKAGTTTVTVKGKKNGKKKTYKFKIKVKKYTNPVKSLKVNKKNLTKKETSKQYFTYIKLITKLGKTKKAKVSVKLKKGFKLTGLEYGYCKALPGKKGIRHYYKKVKNKKNIKRVIATSFVKSYYKKNYIDKYTIRKWAVPEAVCIQIESKSNTWNERSSFYQYVYFK